MCDGCALPVADVVEVRMGIATVSHRVCTAGQGCHACVSKCPLMPCLWIFMRSVLTWSRRAVLDVVCAEQICKTVNDRIAVKVVPARNLFCGQS